jgi:hypothetical protein
MESIGQQIQLLAYKFLFNLKGITLVENYFQRFNVDLFVVCSEKYFWEKFKTPVFLQIFQSI